MGQQGLESFLVEVTTATCRYDTPAPPLCRDCPLALIFRRGVAEKTLPACIVSLTRDVRDAAPVGLLDLVRLVRLVYLVYLVCFVP